MATQWVLSIVCFFVIAQAVVLFIFPDLLTLSVDWAYSAPVFIGVILTIAIGEYLLKQAIARKAQAEQTEKALQQQNA